MTLDDITIRSELRPGDIGYITYRHGVLYSTEYQYGIEFESYVAEGLHEFYSQYDPSRSHVWIAEHNGKIVGFILLMDRGEAAQLRYFYLEPEYRGIGLGSKLMKLFMKFLASAGYTSAYLWTTKELTDAARLYTKHGFELAQEKPSSAFGKEVIEQQYSLFVR